MAEELPGVGPTKSVLPYVGNLAKKKLPDALVNAIVLGVLSLMEEFVVEGEFRCPCKVKHGHKCDNPSPHYTRVMLTVPVFAIFMLALVARFPFVKCVCPNTDKKCKCFYSLNIWEWLAQALFLTGGWFAIILLDGRYTACHESCPTYRVACTEVESAKIEDLESLYTEEFREIRRMHQIGGVSMAFGLAFVYLLLRISCGMRYENCSKCCNCNCNNEDGVCVREAREDDTLKSAIEEHVKQLKESADENGASNRVKDMALEVWENHGVYLFTPKGAVTQKPRRQAGESNPQQASEAVQMQRMGTHTTSSALQPCV